MPFEPKITDLPYELDNVIKRETRPQDKEKHMLIKVPFNAFKEVEKRLKHRFWDKERERSNRAAGLADSAKGTKRSCPMRHDRIAWTGPPHDSLAYVCLQCNAAACEAEIKDMGYDFETVPVEIIDQILDLDLQRQAGGNSKVFGGLG